MSTPRNPSRTALRKGLGLGLLLSLAAALPALAQDARDAQAAGGWGGTDTAPADTSYGYLRLVEGSATLTQGRSGNRSAAEINMPVLSGDRLEVASRGRAEIVLADHNIVRLDGGSVLLFDKLAASADRNDPSTVLRLDEGNIELVVTQNSVGKELPTVVTPNASVYIQAYGTYRITSDRGDWSQVLVRRGTAQVVADSGEQAVRAGEEAVVDGESRSGGTGGVEVRAAGAFDSLESWGRGLDDETRVADDRYVDASLRYQAAPLERYGHWIDVDNQQYWQPNNVDEGWHPFWEGRWDYTPSGQNWVSYEPWGWVPYHYGSWDYLPSHGWAWQPGYAFSPAWVYWYWGPTYVGWCPIGFYSHFYRPFFGDPIFRHGIYGWAGGGFGISAFARWNFIAAGDFGRRDFFHRPVPVSRLEGLPRGIITTDTRAITPAVLRNPGRVVTMLATNPSVARVPGAVGGKLPDVSAFVARQPHLEPGVARAVVADGPRQSGARVAGSPLQPSTLGGGARAFSTGNNRAFGSPGSSPSTARSFRPQPAMPSRSAGGQAPRAIPPQPQQRSRQQQPAPARPPSNLSSGWSNGLGAAGSNQGNASANAPDTSSYRSRFRADHAGGSSSQPSASSRFTPPDRLSGQAGRAPFMPGSPNDRVWTSPSTRQQPAPGYRSSAPPATTYRSSPPGSQYSAPSQRYSPPRQQYSPPSQQYSAPSQRYSTPSQRYSTPGSGYSAPAPRSSAPSYHYSAPPAPHYQSSRPPSSSSSNRSSARGSGGGSSNDRHRPPHG
ncbi:MAG TPA: DUF6600 domain-containing protein [Thermoanaerobaculia bacterium]|nr:DUF6600 domain-containing protein [Thermoanaerobaculia bacterium]